MLQLDINYNMFNSFRNTFFLIIANVFDTIVVLHIMDSLKQVIIMRTDLGMGRGKMAAQAGHACVLGADRVRKTHPEWYEQWFNEGQKKITLKVSSLDDLRQLKIVTAQDRLPYAEVSDAGHTQLEPGTTTCMSIGPAPENAIDRITGHLSLL